MESQRAVFRNTSLAWLAGLLVVAALPQTALAAKDTIVDCDRLASNLRSLDVPDTELPLDDVDHMTTDDSELLPAALESKTVSPVLLLTPRVADLMQEVFNSLPADDAAAEKSANDKELPEATSPAVSAPQQTIEADSTAPVLPSFQREMYRTDI